MEIIDIKNLTEGEYRKLPYPSYSSIKDFLQSRTKYYKKYILGEKVDESKEQGAEDMRFGNVTDCLKFTPDDFDDRYQLSLAGVPDSPQMLKFVNNLHNLCLKNTNDSGILCSNLDTLIEEAYNITGIKRGGLDGWKQKFLVDKEGYDYFVELKSRGNRIIISTEEREWAQGLVDYMNQHPHTRGIMNLEEGEKYHIEDQLKLTGIINGVLVKMMADRVIFNKEAHKIAIVDLKVMSNNEIFPYNYLKLRYYIQNGVYTTIVRQNFPDWEVSPIIFSTIDKYRQNDPVNQMTTEAQYNDAMNGFTHDGRFYKGVLPALEELNWHIESRIWTTSKEVHDNKGFKEFRLVSEAEEG